MNKLTNRGLSAVSVERSHHKSDNYLLTQTPDPLKKEQAMALLALSHTKVEQQVYELMLSETTLALTHAGAFSIRHIMLQTGIMSYSNVRRAREGLVKKMSIEPQAMGSSTLSKEGQAETVFFVYEPDEIFARRKRAGLPPYPKELCDSEGQMFDGIEVIKRLIAEKDLSRREALVALKCASGLSNAEIGEKLLIHPETVKFHLRNIFIKLGVKKRTELMFRLLRQPDLK